MAQYNIPQDLYYTRDHAWVKVEGSHIRIGVTDFMQQLAGEITFIRLPRAGKALAEGTTLSSIQSGKWAGKIQVPLAGKVVEANMSLPGNPKTLNSDSYGAGWICVMEPDDLAGGLQKLLHGPAVEQFIAEETAKHVKP